MQPCADLHPAVLDKHLQLARCSPVGSSQVVSRTTGLLFEAVVLAPSSNLVLLNNLSLQRRMIRQWRLASQQLERHLRTRSGRDAVRLCCLSALPLHVLGCFGSTRASAIIAGQAYFASPKSVRPAVPTSDLLLERLLDLEAEDAAMLAEAERDSSESALLAWLAAPNKFSQVLRRVSVPAVAVPAESAPQRCPSIYHIDGRPSAWTGLGGSAYTVRVCDIDGEPGAQAATSAFLASLQTRALSGAGKPINRAFTDVTVTRVLELRRPLAREAFATLRDQMQGVFDPTRTCSVEQGVMFHGTAWGSLHSICSFGLQPSMDVKNGERLGAGICTTPLGGLALHYAELSQSRSDRQEYAVLVCRVLRGHGKRAHASGLWQRESFAAASSPSSSSSSSFALCGTSSVASDDDLAQTQVCVRTAAQVLVEYILCCQIR